MGSTAEGWFRGPLKGEKTYYWKNGQYKTHVPATASHGEAKIAVFPEQAVIEVDGHRITVWKDGSKKWTLPDGTSAFTWGESKRVRHYDSKNNTLPEQPKGP